MIKNKKSIHINVDPEDHANFKVQCVKRDLSMQEVFAAFAKRVGLESTDMIRFLDQVANEERLAMTFNELFLIEGNDTLAAYLKQIYRFLGLYVFGTGFVFLMFSKIDLFNQRSFRNRYFIALGTLLFSNILLAYYWIPSSHFIFIMWGAILLFLISLYNHTKLEQ